MKHKKKQGNLFGKPVKQDQRLPYEVVMDNLKIKGVLKCIR